MDTVHEHDAPLPAAEKSILGQNALRNFAAFALLATFAASEVRSGYQPPSAHETLTRRSASTYVLPNIDQLNEMEEAYPPISPRSDYAPRIYDEAASSDTTVVYRHEGLKGMSFARPSIETTLKIIAADNLKTMEASASPFFESLGINLYMTQPHPEISSGIVELAPEDLETTRKHLLMALNEISNTPREVIRFANIADVVLARRIPTKKFAASGMAYMKAQQAGIIALDVSGDDYVGHALTFNHELGHQIAFQLDQATNGAFTKKFMQLDGPEATYNSPFSVKNAVEMAIQKKQRQDSNKLEVDIISEYSRESVAEDQADTYASLWIGQQAPDVSDKSYGKKAGAKRVFFTESLDRAVPGSREYVIGASSTASYAHEHVFRTYDAYLRNINLYDR